MHTTQLLGILNQEVMSNWQDLWNSRGPSRINTKATKGHTHNPGTYGTLTENTIPTKDDLRKWNKPREEMNHPMVVT